MKVLHKLKSNFFNVVWLSNHKILLAIFTGAIYLLFSIVLPYFVLWNDSNHTLEFCYYMSQIFAGFCVALSTILALIQYSSSCNDHKNDRLDQKRVEAAKLARSFAEDAMPQINRLTTLYAKDKDLCEKVIEGLFEKELKDFDLNEVKCIFNNYDEIRNKLVAYYYLTYGTPKETDLKKKIQVTLSLKNINISLKEFVNEYNTLANLLEYYAICFNADIVDDETLYQSLHLTFFQTVHMLYCLIFINNTNEYDRLFSNLSELYIRWMKVYRQKKEEEFLKEKNAIENLKNEKRELVVRPNTK